MSTTLLLRPTINTCFYSVVNIGNIRNTVTVKTLIVVVLHKMRPLLVERSLKFANEG